jgi:hypothetical protein
MSNTKRWDSGPPDQSDIRITFVLKGEEAQEFRRWMRRQNMKQFQAGRVLLLNGMVKIGILPNWWRIK